MKGGRVNDVALAGGRCRIGKDMAKPSITSLGAYLRPLHFVCVVGDFDEEIFRNGFRERGQADVAVELVDRSEQRFASNDIDVDADLFAVPEFILKRCLRAVPRTTAYSSAFNRLFKTASVGTGRFGSKVVVSFFSF